MSAEAPPAPSVHDQLVGLRDQVGALAGVLAEIKALLSGPPAERKAYSVEEVARMLGKSDYTVREWCRQARVNASKRADRRGASEVWSIPAGEVTRIREEGLLPFGRGVSPTL